LSFQEKQADLIYKAVKSASVSPSSIEKGDFIVVTSDSNDVMGVVTSLSSTGGITSVSIHTPSGVQTLQVDNNNFIHLLQKAAMLDLKKHMDYERANEDLNKEVDMISKNDGKHKERPQFSVEKSDKSALPTSKISSLSLRKIKED